jgi:hypothetical protein
MTALVMEAALRSLVLALAVWLALKMFRVRNVLAEKAAWILVLAAAVLMPLMLMLAARWPALPAPKLVLPAIAVHRAARADAPMTEMGQAAAAPHAAPAAAPEAPTMGSVAPGRVSGFISRRSVAAGSTSGLHAEDASGIRGNLASTPLDPPGLGSTGQESNGAALSRGDLTRAELAGADSTGAESFGAHSAQMLASSLRAVAPGTWAAALYLLIAFALCLRLLLGLAVTLRVWRAADPVPALTLPAAAGLKLRTSAQISSPVTIGWGILLPAEYSAWGEEKLRMVLAHERSHVRQGDFYLQLLASLYAALLWLSPLGWWLKRKLSDLGEAIGDRSGLEAAQSRTAYARVLLEFAATPRPTVLGVAMARPSSLSHRMERLLNESAFRQAFSSRGRAFAAALLLPAIFFAAAALVRVEAASTPAQAARAHEVAQAAARDVAASQAGEASQIAAKQAAASQIAGQAAGQNADNDVALQTAADVIQASAAAQASADAQSDAADAAEARRPESSAPFAAPVIQMETTHGQAQQEPEGVSTTIVMDPSTSSANSYAFAYNHVAETVSRLANIYSVRRSGSYAVMAGGAHAAQGGGAAENATFDRTLSVNGKLELHVATGSGNIHLTRGTANQVVVHGRVSSQKAEDADEVHALAANPPIKQEGNVIRIGVLDENRRNNHIEIDYDVEAPADATLEAASGSGEIVDEGVGPGAKLSTGSGNITATGLTSGFKAETGSGNIAIDQAGEGDAKAETGSGDINVKGVHGALKAETGSGSIKAEGTPSSEWKLETGSGTVELTPGNAPLTLSASTGSGRITSDRPMALNVSSDGHRMSGQLNGGGPNVVIETGSGNIRIHD